LIPSVVFDAASRIPVIGFITKPATPLPTPLKKPENP
jgi:hypothetical protein